MAMPICGMVITLVENEAQAKAAMDRLGRDTQLTLGLRAGRRLALAADTQSNSAQAALHRMLLEDPGILHVDTTFVELDAFEVSQVPGVAASQATHVPL